MHRRLSAILAADVVGYSRQMDRDEAGTLGAVRELHRNIVAPLVGDWRGQVVKQMGDGWLAEFASAVDAVRCALSMQERSAETALSMRVGVHVGEVAHVEGDIFGTGVNIAARLEAAADPGGVAISDDVRRLIRSVVDTAFHSNGSLELKNIAEPVEVWSWPRPLTGISPWGRPGGSKPRLAVSPLSASGDAATEMSAALLADLRDAFGRQSGLVLVSDASSADFELAGSVRVAGTRWRVSVQLNETGSGGCVWSGRLDEDGQDPFDVQDRLIARIAGTVRVRIPGLLAEKLRDRPLGEMGVEDLLNHAMGCHLTPSAASWSRARSALERVLELDRENWMAMTMLSWNRLGITRILGWRQIGAEDAARAQDLIERAMRLQPHDHLVRTVRGAFLFHARGLLETARLDLEEALALNPNYYHTLDLMAQVALCEGDADRAEELCRATLACDPAYPFRHLYYRGAGLVALGRGDHAAAVDRLLRADRAAPGLPANLAALSAAHALSGRMDRARETYRALLELAPDFSVPSMARLPFRDPELAERVPRALSAVAED